MGEVPHQRAHQRVVLAVQFGVVEVDQRQGALPARVSSAASAPVTSSSPPSPAGVRAVGIPCVDNPVGEVIARTCGRSPTSASRRAIGVGQLGRAHARRRWPRSVTAAACSRGSREPARAADPIRRGDRRGGCGGDLAAAGLSSSGDQVNTTAGQTVVGHAVRGSGSPASGAAAPAGTAWSGGSRGRRRRGRRPSSGTVVRRPSRRRSTHSVIGTASGVRTSITGACSA